MKDNLSFDNIVDLVQKVNLLITLAQGINTEEEE